MRHSRCRWLLVLAVVGSMALGCSPAKEKAEPPKKASAAMGAMAVPNARPDAAAPARPMRVNKIVAKPRARPVKTAPRPSPALLKRLGLSHLKKTGVVTCDRILATLLCLLPYTLADAQLRSAKDLKSIFRKWQQRLRANTQSARDALERDCKSTIPVLRRVWASLPTGKVCVPKQ